MSCLCLSVCLSLRPGNDGLQIHPSRSRGTACSGLLRPGAATACTRYAYWTLATFYCAGPSVQQPATTGRRCRACNEATGVKPLRQMDGAFFFFFRLGWKRLREKSLPGRVVQCRGCLGGLSNAASVQRCAHAAWRDGTKARACQNTWTSEGDRSSSALCGCTDKATAHVSPKTAASLRCTRKKKPCCSRLVPSVSACTGPTRLVNMKSEPRGGFTSGMLGRL